MRRAYGVDPPCSSRLQAVAHWVFTTLLCCSPFKFVEPTMFVWPDETLCFSTDHIKVNSVTKPELWGGRSKWQSRICSLYDYIRTAKTLLISMFKTPRAYDIPVCNLSLLQRTVRGFLRCINLLLSVDNHEVHLTIKLI